VCGGSVLVAAEHTRGLHPVLHGLVRPVKGEILRLALRPGAFPLPRRTVRALVDGQPLTCAPRGRDRAGRPVEVGFDTTVTVGGVRDLLRDAERIPSRIAEARGWNPRPAARQPGQPAVDRRARARRPAGRHWPPPQRDAARARHRGRDRRPAARRLADWAGPCGRSCSSPACPQVESACTGRSEEVARGRLDQRGTPGAGVGRLAPPMDAGLPRTGGAVAVDGEVVPRAQWAVTALADGARGRS
jgi:hypothetical protein